MCVTAVCCCCVLLWCCCGVAVLCCCVLVLQPDSLAALLSALRSLGCVLSPGLLGAASDVAVATMGSFSVASLVELLQVNQRGRGRGEGGSEGGAGRVGQTRKGSEGRG